MKRKHLTALIYAMGEIQEAGIIVFVTFHLTKATYTITLIC